MSNYSRLLTSEQSSFLIGSLGKTVYAPTHVNSGVKFFVVCFFLMAKRARISGKEMDKFPQSFQLNIVQSAINSPTQITFQLPISRFGSSVSGKQNVIEIVSVTSNVEVIGAISGAAILWRFILGLKPGGAVAGLGLSTGDLMRAPNFIYKWFAHNSRNSLLGEPGFTGWLETDYRDLTTGGGFGFLVATDNVTMMINSVGADRILEFGVTVQYRFVSIGLEEYIGLVQQQSGVLT